MNNQHQSDAYDAAQPVRREDYDAHTPGEWTVTGPNGYLNQIGIGIDTGRGISPIAAAYGAGEEVKANARLIAAAPELLDACQAMAEWDAREQDHAVDFAERTKMCIAAFDKARAAIAKATQVEP